MSSGVGSQRGASRLHASGHLSSARHVCEILWASYCSFVGEQFVTTDKGNLHPVDLDDHSRRPRVWKHDPVDRRQNVDSVWWITESRGRDGRVADVLVEDPPEDYDPTPYIEEQAWIFAKTMSQNPHWYVLLRNSTNWREHLRFLLWIRRRGFDELYRG
jgi:hypothetical protein